MSATFKLRANALSGSTLTLFIAPQGGAVANGSGDNMTESSGLFSATVDESLSGLYDYWVKDTDDDVRYSGTVYCEGSTWIADQAPTIYPPVERTVTDSTAIEFYWPQSGATFATNASKRRFAGQTGSQEATLSGAITAVSGVTGLYKLAYALADRAADATTIIPVDVNYKLVDDNGNYAYLALRIVDVASTGLILPYVGTMRASVSGTNLALFTKETTTVSISLYDSAGTAVDLEALTIQVVFENARRIDIATLNDGDVTKANNLLTFTVPSAVTDERGDKYWSLRDTANNDVLLRGVVQVEYAASAD